MSQLDLSWDVVDEWWPRYTSGLTGELIELHDVLRELNEQWEASACPFDVDPLTINWTTDIPQSGPLRTNQEENWSRWLAQLIRDSKGAFTTAVFDTEFDPQALQVQCEKAFQDEQVHDRRVDIIAQSANRGVTVEVKIEDEHYEKTGEAAYLAEKNDPRDRTWAHYLLLPKRKNNELQGSFGDRVRETGSQIRIDPMNPEERHVAVLYWSDVARVIRHAILIDAEPSDHWCASGYLFTTLIEQRIMDCYPLSTIERVQTERVGISDVTRLQAIDPADQLAHLKTIHTEVQHG